MRSTAKGREAGLKRDEAGEAGKGQTMKILIVFLCVHFSMKAEP